jgi:hypothetical protein
MPSKGICMFVGEDSESLNYVKVDDSVNLKYFTTAAVYKAMIRNDSGSPV